MPKRDVVVIGGSAGAIEALQELLSVLPADLDATVLVVVHVPPGGTAALAPILDRAGPLPVTAARDGEALSSGHVLTCVPDHHLLLSDGHAVLRRGPRENGHRPAIDPLFRSAARWFGPRAVAVLVSGTLSDGTAGIAVVRGQGGLALVQHPDDARHGDMPANAIASSGADHVGSAKELAQLLIQLVAEDVEVPAQGDDGELEAEVALMDEGDRVFGEHRPGRPSLWTCPDCSGVLWEIDDEVLRFRCRVGHAWVEESLRNEQGLAVETALWAALRAMEDRLALTQRLVQRAEAGRHTMTVERFRDDIAGIERNVEVLRGLLQPVPTDRREESSG